MDEVVLGIDLGTTFSTAAWVDENGQPQLIENAEGKVLTPSVVLIEDEGIVVGDPAMNQAIIKKDRVVRWIKREMGDEEYRFCGLSPVQISAEILRKLKADSETALGRSLRKAVITCPAYFAAPEVANTRKAGELAGFEVLEIVREPVAAAVHYGAQHLNDGQRVLVYDLGGGTFDASVLDLHKGVFRPLATLGDRYLGGHDWTSDLLTYASERLAGELGVDPRDDPAVHQTLYERCESAKQDLARLKQVSIACVVGQRTGQVKVTQETFEELTEARIERTIATSQGVLVKADPPLAWEDLDLILLVGGSTRLRRVPVALAAASGKVPVRTAEVDTMVALGAAVLARGVVRSRRTVTVVGGSAPAGAFLMPINFERRCVRHLGTRVVRWEESRPVIGNSPVIPYGTALPAACTRDAFAIAYSSQPYFDVPVVEFDDMGEDVILGTWRFHARAGAQAGDRIAVTFLYNQNAEAVVLARDLTTGEELQPEKVQYQEPDLSKSALQRRDLVFALDISGSMSEGKLEDAKRALLDTAAQLNVCPGHGLQVGVVAFGGAASEVCPLTSRLEDLRKAIAPLGVTGTTRMDLGIDLAVGMLMRSAPGCGREIALITDGMPDSREFAEIAALAAQKAGVRLSAVGIGADVDEAFLRQIADQYGLVQSADQLAQVLPNLLRETGEPGRSVLTWGNI